MENPDRRMTDNYEYTGEELSYEGSHGGFTFSLVKSPKEVFTAANKLRNCLRSAEYRYALKSYLLFVVRKDKKIVAAVECSISQSETDFGRCTLAVREARSILNDGLGRIDGLPEAFTAWREANNIRIAR